ncbi:fatty acid transporter protein-like [Trypanosoma grayi]|uniref:fatty acid transporter protein-like n=1 Tax=Trypanosoma grayi TaxID=71804 RepID=UPI0004F484A7|nr:fatty acid transporter protein-like [Trypanosoma grayi]KEG09475.1 fatty acid transporter protein-like [Trypanosoma grayi]
MSQYAYITTKEYIKLGCSLGAVQTRSSLRNARLRWRDAWGSVLPGALRRDRTNSRDDPGDSTTNSVQEACGAVDECLLPLLHEVSAVAEVTHGQSISFTLLDAFRKQAALVADAPREHQVAFEMAATDAALPAMKLRGAPLSLTYGDAVALTSLLSEALAWEWHGLTCGAADRVAAAERQVSHGNSPATRPHTLALMLDNCTEFNPIWMAVAEVSVWMTFLDALYDAEPQAPAVYHHCSAALLNTNLVNHRMLCHSLECVTSELLVLEEKYVPLLFDGADDDGKSEAQQKNKNVALPPCVKRVFVWRGTPANASIAPNRVQPWMLERVQNFNEMHASSKNASSATLDLFDLVRHHYEAPRQHLFPILTKCISQFPPDVFVATMGKQELQKQQKATVAAVRSRTKEALLRFRPVMPVLHIYTSGTTGLPKAARFSHLRFFAAVFFSAMLPQREKTKEVLLGKQRNGEGEENGLWSKCASALFGRRRHLPSFEEDLNVLTVYNCLPMYHTVGCVFCIGHLLHGLQEQQQAAGAVDSYRIAPQFRGKQVGTEQLNPRRSAPTARMVIRSKFSASNFTSDLQLYRVTVFQYIGEILRYALHYENRQKTRAPNGIQARVGEGGGDKSKNSSTGGNHEAGRWVVPFAFGNGLRNDIWSECKNSLHIAQVVEFYSSTEGNVFLINLFDLPGVVGHLPLFPRPIYLLSTHFNPLFPFRVVKYDFEKGEVWRQPLSGRCAYCGVGEIGEIVGEIIQGFDMFALRRFDGYHSEVETKKNVIRGVFKPKDAYFLSGDLVEFDAMGFVTFVDRVGETFRWKGENVSTTEVMNALSGVSGRTVTVQEAIVYGVVVPNREGRAGMAKLQLAPVGEGSSPSQRLTLEEERLFLQNELYGLLSGASGTPAVLPGYAIPMCIRIDEDASNGCEGQQPQQQQQGPYFPAGKAPCGPITPAPLSSDAAHTTTTFKYRRHVLVRDGYRYALRYALSSSENGPSRVYVLVTKRELLEAVGAKPLPSSFSCGYVPLNTKTLVLLGEELQKCGW